MELKDTLKYIREKNGLTKRELCEKTGISERAYLTYEFGEREPKISVIAKLADFYGVTTDYLLGREPAPDPFADLNLNKESEEDVIDKYMSLPPNIRACLMDVLLQLADAAKQRKNEQPDGTQGNSKLSISTTLGTIEDEIEKMAMSKDGA